MAKDNELKESVKEPIKSLVKEIVSDTVYKLVKASAKKTVIALRDKLKEEAARRLEETLKEAAEKRLNQTVKQLEKEFTKDTPQGSEYLKNVEQNLSKRLRKYLPPLKEASPLITIALSCFCLLLIWAGVYCCWIKPTSSPQSDLLITWIGPEWTGEGVIIYYTIANQGETEAGGSCTYLYLNDNLLMVDCVAPIPSGEISEEFFSPYPFSETDVYVHMKLCADGGKHIDESNEENNCTTLKFNLPD